MQFPNVFIKKHHRIIILCLVIALLLSLLYPYVPRFSLVESMIANDVDNSSGINIPIPSSLPSSLKMKPEQQKQPEQPEQSSTRTDSCPPCPPCGRCPEPNFECKKVPKYRDLMINDHAQIPRPINPEYTTFAV